LLDYAPVDDKSKVMNKRERERERERERDFRGSIIIKFSLKPGIHLLT
jgi:hypothetical protein